MVGIESSLTHGGQYALRHTLSPALDCYECGFPVDGKPAAGVVVVSVEEDFDKWWVGPESHAGARELAKTAYVAIVKATAIRCVEICNPHGRTGEDWAATNRCAWAIKEEFDL